MASKHLILGAIPDRLLAAFDVAGLAAAVVDARTSLGEATQPWNLVEESEGIGLQPLDVPFKVVPHELSDAEKRYGREILKRTVERLVE